MRVLVVEDDEGIGAGLQRVLTGEGYAVTWCRTAEQAVSACSGQLEAVLLDLGLPDMDGLVLCRRIRGTLPDTPIIMLTARGTESDVVVGLDAGADDYLVKPFRLAELLARLRAHTRRRTGPAPHTASGELRVGDLTVDPTARRACLAGTELRLRAKEFDLLALLAARAGRVVSRGAAMQQVWDAEDFSSTKTLDVHVAALRQRLGETGPERSRITTLRGVGYRLETDPTERPPG